jgi:hypothetical protein
VSLRHTKTRTQEKLGNSAGSRLRTQKIMFNVLPRGRMLTLAYKEEVAMNYMIMINNIREDLYEQLSN